MLIFFSTPPSLHAGCVRAMVGHLKFRVFPPFPLQPFIADRLRSITRLEKGEAGSSCSLLRCPKRLLCRSRNLLWFPRELIQAGGCCFFSFTFVRLTHRILDVRIVPLSVQIMKSCSIALRPLEDYSDGSEQWQPALKEWSESDFISFLFFSLSSWSFVLNKCARTQLN